MALRALSIAATGGRALLSQIDTIAHNLANVNTPAYKRSRANFADLFYQELQRSGPGEPGRGPAPAGIPFGAGVRLVSTEKLFEQGTLQRTDRDLDLAVEGGGFFRVRRPDGSAAYTRAGNLQRDADGNLATAEGYVIDPPISVPGNLTALSIDRTGRVLGLDPRRPDALQSVGQVLLTQFVNPSGLGALGDNLYRETPASGPGLEGLPGGEGFGWIRQRFLESSNVDVVRELTDLIAAHRAFEINAKMIEAADQVLQAVNGLKRERP